MDAATIEQILASQCGGVEGRPVVLGIDVVDDVLNGGNGELEVHGSDQNSEVKSLSEGGWG